VIWANGREVWEIAAGGLTLDGYAADIRTYEIDEVEVLEVTQ
jgi:hypothetical protein